MIEPVKRVNVTDSIVNQIKELVLQGKLNKGDRLPPERELMNSFQVGRPSLREALKVLEAQGLIKKNQKGTVITENHDKFFTDSLMFQLYFSSADWNDIFEARKFIERELTYMAAKKATAEDFKEMEKTIIDMELAVNTHNQDEYVTANLDFHEIIAKSSKNLVMYHLYQSINGLIEQIQCRAVDRPGIKNESLQYHKDIFAAMKQRDAELASEEMVRHITCVHQHLLIKEDD